MNALSPCAGWIEIRKLSIAFGDVPVLQDISVSLPVEGITVVIGPSGAGKSTLLQAVAGLVEPTTGDIRISRTDTLGHSDRPSRTVGVVFQDPLLFPWRRIRHNVEYGLEGLCLSRMERRARAQTALALVNLQDQAGKWPHELSGGQRQRAGLARALAVEPALLLMDEPFSALDPRIRARLQEELLAIVVRQRIGVLFVTHDMAEAVHLADRILVLGEAPARLLADIRVEEPRPRSRVGQNAMVARLTQTFHLPGPAPEEEG